MDCKKCGLLKVILIFVALETVFIYYAVGLLAVGYRPGNILHGFPHAGYLPVTSTPFQYFPGLGYLVKAFFPLYYLYYILNPDLFLVPPPWFHSQVVGATHFLLAFWIGLIIAAVTTAIVCSIKIKGVYRVHLRISIN